MSSSYLLNPKEVWEKQGRKFLPFTSTNWSSPQLHRHQELHTCHTRKHTRMYTKSSNAKLTLSQRQSSKRVRKQTKPQLTAVTKENWCKHGFLFTMDVVCTHFPSCTPLNVFCDGCKLCLPVYSYINPMFHQHSRLPKKKLLRAKPWKLLTCRLPPPPLSHNLIRASRRTPPSGPAMPRSDALKNTSSGKELLKAGPSSGKRAPLEKGLGERGVIVQHSAETCILGPHTVPVLLHHMELFPPRQRK